MSEFDGCVDGWTSVWSLHLYKGRTSIQLFPSPSSRFHCSDANDRRRKKPIEEPEQLDQWSREAKQPTDKHVASPLSQLWSTKEDQTNYKKKESDEDKEQEEKQKKQEEEEEREEKRKEERSAWSEQKEKKDKEMTMMEEQKEERQKKQQRRNQ